MFLKSVFLENSLSDFVIIAGLQSTGLKYLTIPHLKDLFWDGLIH